MNDSTEQRPLIPSNAVTKGVAIGAPLNLVQAFLVMRLSSRYSIPVDVAGAGIALVAQGISSAISYFSRGGRQGEPQ